jgi:hypothetical protein
MKKYFLTNDLQALNRLSTYVPYGTILGWISFSIDESELDVLKSVSSFYYEIDMETAVFGFRSFGDPRSEIKVSSDEIDLQLEYDDSLNVESYKERFDAKIKIPMTEKRYDCVVKTMKLVAKLVIEHEFNLKYKQLIALTTDLERASWQLQLTDDEFCDTLSEIKQNPNFVDSLFDSKTKYENSVKDLYIRSQKLKQKFYSCETIKELNVLFEDYMGLPMHNEQAKEEGRYIKLEDGSIQRLGVKPGLKF